MSIRALDALVKKARSKGASVIVFTDVPDFPDYDKSDERKNDYSICTPEWFRANIPSYCQMTRERSLVVKSFLPKRYIGLLGLFIIILLFALAFHKLPRIVKSAHQIADTIVTTIEWEMKPSIIVKSGDQPLARELQRNRFISASGPLQIDPTNSRYFTDESRKAIYLAGASTLTSLQDSGNSDPPPVFDYKAYLDLLQTNNHNFFRLYAYESPRWNLEKLDDNYWYEPMPYQRPGPGNAQDGKPKFDLTLFNQAYFDRLRQRVMQARDRGIYVSIMLFNGDSVAKHKGIAGNGKNNPWKSHPFNRSNNINGIDGNPKGNNSGGTVQTLTMPAITELQEAYVQKVIDTVNDLDNVLYEISNESRGDSRDWQYHMVTFIKNYEKRKPKQHPVGMTHEFPDGDDSTLFAGLADWMSPGSELYDPPIADGKKVIINDTDHICGFCGDREWVWKSFTRGDNVAFLDQYNYLTGSRGFDSQWDEIRLNLGYAFTYANRMNLMAMTPRSDLASTGYCLAKPSPNEAEYLIYLPLLSGKIKRYLNFHKITVDLSNTPGELSVEWFNPKTGLVANEITVTGGGNRTFIAPFDGDAVLYIRSI